MFRSDNKGTFDVLKTKPQDQTYWDVFRGCKQTSKVCYLDLECKLQQDSTVWCIYKFKGYKTVQRRYLATSKQQTRYQWCFETLKCWGKGNNGGFRSCKQTSKVQFKYLAFERLKISSNKVNSDQKAESKVRMMFLEFKIQQATYAWCL